MVGMLVATVIAKRSVMKKHLLAILIVTAFTVTAKAQIQKGYYLIGGDLAGFSLGLSDGRPFTMSITPKVAWFRNDNLATLAWQLPKDPEPPLIMA
jgi:hypothetical protein